MSLPPQKQREIVLQLLFSLDSGANDTPALISLISKELEVSKKYVLIGMEKAHKIIANLAMVDEQISAVSQDYQFDRIQKVEKNVLRLGVYELFLEKELPPKVAIAEGMRLARKFGTPESSTFVNAVLDAIYKKMSGGPIDESSLRSSLAVLIESEAIAEEAAKQAPPALLDEDESIDF